MELVLVRGSRLLGKAWPPWCDLNAKYILLLLRPSWLGTLLLGFEPS